MLQSFGVIQVCFLVNVFLAITFEATVIRCVVIKLSSSNDTVL